IPASGIAGAVAMPLAVGAVALSAGLAMATFVKAFGVGFLARPRGPEAERATESPPTMLAGMGLAAACCAALALGPTVIVPGLARAVGTLLPGGVPVTGTVTLHLSGIAGTISPLLIALAVVAAIALLAGL